MHVCTTPTVIFHTYHRMKKILLAFLLILMYGVKDISKFKQYFTMQYTGDVHTAHPMVPASFLCYMIPLCPHIRHVFFSPDSTKSLPCHTASGDNCTSSICPNTVVTYTCNITNGTAAGYTDWTLPTGTCPTNAFPDKIRMSQYVSGQCTAQGTSTCGPYRASSIQSSDPTYCLSSILTVNITAAMNGSTLMCSITDLLYGTISTVVSMATINVVGMLFACVCVCVCVVCYISPVPSLNYLH